jgi:phosphatidylserine/phosphatidylglycerophosphate/cardiolipin synthase-like enzyme
MLKKLTIITLIGIDLLTTTFAETQNYQPEKVQVYFSPNGNCTAAIVTAIENTKSSIFVQAYSFTSAPIAQALVNAKKRGIEIFVILDKSQKTEKYTSASFLNNNGIPVYIDSKHAIAHNKIIIIDNKTIITGSFNFSKSAEERNAENLLIIEDIQLAKTYLKNWNEHQKHSEEFNTNS